jgi:hypothetical protein
MRFDRLELTIFEVDTGFRVYPMYYDAPRGVPPKGSNVYPPFTYAPVLQLTIFEVDTGFRVYPMYYDTPVSHHKVQMYTLHSPTHWSFN